MMRYLCVLCGMVWLISACSSGYYMKRGNVIYETGRFYKAASKYEKAYHKARIKEYRASAAVHAAQAYQNVNRHKDAYNWYRRAAHANERFPEICLKLAQVCLLNEDQETAREYYQRHEELYGDGKGKDGLYYLEQVDKDRKEQGRYLVRLKREFNSRYSDFAPIYVPGDTCSVYLASSRNAEAKKRRKIDPVTGDGYSHIFKAAFVEEIRTVGKNGKVKVKRFKEPRWLQPVSVKDSIYSSGHEGAMSFSSDGSSLYFTSSRTIKGSHIGTRIYKASKGTAKEGEEKEKWTSVSLAGICGDSVSIGHPALTPDGNRLYFVTDRLPGGRGGKDIWYVENSAGSWGMPVNAGEQINTAGDEMFPYVRDNGELYFASNGRYGYGGLDLYKAVEEEGKITVIHLPAPLNSFADDFGIVFKPGEENGLLTSSRTGRSDDIYSFSFIPQQLRVKLLAKNTVTEIPVAKVNVTVTADDGSVAYLETDSAGIAGMEVVPDREYVFVAEHSRFLKGKGTVSTYREKADRLYEVKLALQPIENPIVIPNIYFDVAKWDLRPDAMENLKELLSVLADNPHIVIELSAHTDMVGNDRANRVLSENRAQAVVEYLIEQGVYWDRLVAKGYGETQPRQINEKDAREYTFLKPGNVLDERFVNRLKGEQKELAMQLNRRIEFKVLRTDYKPGPRSLHNPNRKAVAAEEGVVNVGKTQLKDLKAVTGKFYTLQLGVFKNIPVFVGQFKVLFTEKLDEGTVRYCTGAYDDRKEAEKAAAVLGKKGIECLVRECNH